MAKAHNESSEYGEELIPTRRTLLERLRDLEDADSWQEFFDNYWKLIYCCAVKAGLSDSEAEDIVQETMVGVARKMPSFVYDPETCSFKGWLMLVVRCRIIDHWRSRHKHLERVARLPADTRTTELGCQIPDAAAEQAFAAMWDEEWHKNIVDTAMERVKREVKPEYYQVFYLYSVKKMPVRKIQELFNISAAKVYVVRHRIARLIKREVQDLEQQELKGKGLKCSSKTPSNRLSSA